MIITLLFALIFYSFLSWILLFRDIRALLIIHNFYPAAGDVLLKYRDLLLAHGLNSWPTLLFVVSIMIAFAAYLLLLKRRLPLPSVVALTAIFQFILFFSYPILSTDIFYYILSDRLSTVYHRNVWTTSTSAIPNDPFYHLTDWRSQTKIYGPVNQFFYDIPSRLAGDNLIFQIATHKLIVVIFVFATFYILYKLVRKMAPDHVGQGLQLVFWNPLFILETAGSGHNDIIMLFFSAVAAYFFLGEMPLLSGLALACGVQIKLVPALLAAFFICHYLAKRQFRNLLKFLISFLTLNFLLLWTTGVAPAMFVARTFYSVNLYWQSLPTVLRLYAPALEPVLTVILVAFLLIQFLLVIFRRKSPITAYTETLFAFFLFFLKTYWNWYAVWLLIFLPLIKNKLLQRAILFFTFTSTLVYGVLWLAQRFNYGHPLWSAIIYLVLSVIPATYYVFAKYFQKAR